MDGALMHLVAVGAENVYFPLQSSLEMVDIALTFGINQIPRSCDIIKFKHIAFTSPIEMSINEFKNIVKNYEIELVIGGSCMNKLQFDFLCELNPVEQIGNTFCVIYPDDYTTNGIDLVSLQYHAVILHVIGENTPNFQLDLFAEYEFLQTEQRQRLITNAHEKIIQQIRLCGTGRVEQSMEIRLNADHPTKGFFIVGCIDNITNISLQLNDQQRLNYTRAMINLYCFKISNNLLYLSFSNLNDYAQTNVESFAHALNFSRIDTIKMTLCINNVTNDEIKIYNVCGNILRYGSGMAGIAYAGYNHLIATTPYVPIPNRPRENLNTPTFTTQYRAIEPDKTNCPITQCDIDEYYCRCNTCNNNFDFDAIYAWVVTNRKTNCPLCRSIWTNYVKYNKNVSNLETIVAPNEDAP